MDKDIEILLKKLNDEQLKIINKLDYNKNDFSDLVEKIEEYMQLECLD